MTDYVNLKTLQKAVNELLISLQFINDKRITLPLPEDFSQLNKKIETVREQINEYLPPSQSDEYLPPPQSDKEVIPFEDDFYENIVKTFIPVLQDNHKKTAELKIFNSTLQTLLNDKSIKADMPGNIKTAFIYTREYNVSFCCVI